MDIRLKFLNQETHSAWNFVIFSPVAISSATRETAGSKFKLAAAMTSSPLYGDKYSEYVIVTF